MNMKITIGLIVGSIIVISGMSGCYYDKEDELYPNSVCVMPDTVKFSTDVQHIFMSRCASSGCHVPGTGRIDLSTYQGDTFNIGIIKQRAIEQKSMPPTGPLSNCEIMKLQKWIDAGYKND